MQRITISEKDLTAREIEVQIDDRIFIPGFAVSDASKDYIGKAVDCDTLSQFYSIFRGTDANGRTLEPTFAVNLQYPEYIAGLTTNGFSSLAIPAVTDSSGEDTGVMFFADQVDPSYRLAVKLLESGARISYVRMNEYGYSYDPHNNKEYDSNVTGRLTNTADTVVGDFTKFAKRYLAMTGGKLAPEEGSTSVSFEFNFGVTAKSRGIFETSGEVLVGADAEVFASAYLSDEGSILPYTAEGTFLLFTSSCIISDDKYIVKLVRNVGATSREIIKTEYTKISDVRDFLRYWGLPSTWCNKESGYTWNKNFKIRNVPRTLMYGIVRDSSSIESGTSIAESGYDPIAEFLKNWGMSEQQFLPQIDVDTATMFFAKDITDTIVYDVTVQRAYDYMYLSVFNCDLIDDVPTHKTPLLDISEVDVKYITSGGYPVFEYYTNNDKNAIAKQMAYIADSRGDCVALIDHTDNRSRELVGKTSVYAQMENGAGIPAKSASYVAMFTPWCEWSDGAVLSASAVYLLAVTTVNKYSTSWNAIAGVARGIGTTGNTSSVVSLRTDKTLTNAIAEYYQQDQRGCSLNPITYIKPYGYTIWGNKTLVNASGAATQGYATQFLNIRNLVSDVKKQARIAAVSCMFELNTDILWLNFKSMITPLLDKMVSNVAIKNYKLIKGTTRDRQKIVADIRLYPIYSVESFDITVIITDEDDVVVTE